MTESMFKSELLKQDANHPAEAEVKKLRKMLEEEDRRAKRLARWAMAVWVLFFAMIAVSLGLPIVMYHLARDNSPHVSPSTQPVADTTAQPPRASPGHVPNVFLTILGVAAVVGFFSLPFIAITLTIKAILARRTAGKRQILAALAGIEAQLHILAEGRSRPQF